MFIHLRSHSYYSFLDGLPSPGELAQAAARQGMPALALTDVHSLTGAVEFYDACQATGVRPVLGLELRVGLPRDWTNAASDSCPDVCRLALLAMDLSGWRSLCRLSSAVQAGLALPFERLAEDSAGLICLSGGRGGLVAGLLQDGGEPAARDYLQRLAVLFRDRLYVELQMHTPQDAAWVIPLAALAKRLELPAVASHDIHYLAPEQAHLQRVASAIRRIQKLDELPDEAVAPPDAFFTSQVGMESRFERLGPEFAAALAASQEVAERCRLELPLGVPHYPEMPLPPGLDSLEALRHKAEAGALHVYGEVTPPIRARLDHELGVIGECGYASLFLIMEEIVQFAHRSGVPISSRGSAASSLVAHCLGITSPDPLRLNLYFERFLNPARATPPDIDTDLCSRRRGSVINFVYERFGQDRVAMVCTINRFRRRSALREVAKAYGLPPGEIKKMTDSLPQRWFGSPSQQPKSEDPFGELARQYPLPRNQAIFRDAAALLGVPHHLSIHPGGVVISPSPLTDLAPTLWAAKGVLTTQFDLESIERLGLVKIDLLGIRGLTVLGDVAQAIQEGPTKTLQPSKAASPDRSTRRGSRRGQQAIDPSPLDVLEAISEDDSATRELVQAGRTIGCFQIESPGMRATLKEVQAKSVDDLMAALALFRPGPLTGGLKDAFVRRHRGLEKPSQLHPALTPLLADTYGVILYQEQVLRIAHELGGFSLGDSDLLRRAMSHFDPGKQMQTLKEKFIAGAYQRSQVPAPVAERIWELMAAFAGYGFPKAHAASYALIGWRSAWCKVHYPAEFMAAVLANWGGYYSQRVYLTEARRLGLEIRPPHVNHAYGDFCVRYLERAGQAGVQPVLFMGLNQVRELTRRTQELILRERPFHSLTDFLVRADPRPVEAENLVRCGALAGLGNSLPALLRQLASGSWRSGQLPLFAAETFGPAVDEPDWSLAERVAAQEEILGTGVDAHPLELLADRIEAARAMSTVEAAARVGWPVRVAGMRQTWARGSGRGDGTYSMSLEDLEGMLEVTIPADIYRRHRAALTGPGPYVIEGVVEMDALLGEPVIRAEQVWKL